MKTSVLIILMMTIWAFNSPGQSKKVTNLLKNKETRTEVFGNILNNHKFMMEFMEALKGNEYAQMMMEDNSQMMQKDREMEMTPAQIDRQHEHQMMGHGDMMMGMMKENPEMMQKMMGDMMDMCDQDSAMCSKMADTMTDHPQMMEMCMKKMKEKGMMGKDGMMKIMNSGNTTTGKEHSHQH